MSRQWNFEEGEILLFDKPFDWSSFDLVQKIKNTIKKHTGLKVKVGHAGTLDPYATGLLIICTGKFTKKIYQLKHTAGVLMKKSKFETQLIQAHYRHSSSATTEIYLSVLKNHIYQDLKTKFPDINDF